MPLRKGECSARSSLCEIAPHLTASKNASRRLGSSKLDGSGRVDFSCMEVPGSSSQTTSNSSPRPSSSTEESLSRCDVTLPAVAGFTAEGTISITTKGRLRTTTNWPTSGHETIKVYLKSYVRGGQSLYIH